MGINKKGKRKIVVGGKTYWWFVKEVQKVPRVTIISDDKAFLAECRLYNPVLQVMKSPYGKGQIAVPLKMEDQHGQLFTPGYVKGLIELALREDLDGR